MGNPFLFADRFSGAVVHLTTGWERAGSAFPPFTAKQSKIKNKKCPRQLN
jgi:hypothetical protein